MRIADRALVVAAELADRYITNRFLPDKAIDLVDEACSNMRVQLDSMPEEMDNLQRQMYRLQVEEAALSKEKDSVRPSCTCMRLPLGACLPGCCCKVHLDLPPFAVC